MLGIVLRKHLRTANNPDKESNKARTLRKAQPKSLEVAFVPPQIALSFFPDLVRDISARDQKAEFDGMAMELGATRKVEWDIRGIYHIATSTSADAIRRIASMNPCRVPLATGILCHNPPIQDLSGQKKRLLKDALALVLHRMLTPAEYPAENIPHDDWFRKEICPLVALEDGHVLAVITALSMALATGRLDLAVAGLFGASKTRAIAVLYASLLAIEPELKLIVVCKENNAACFMAHLLSSLNLPTSVRRLIMRAPGNKAYRKETTHTLLDVTPAGRHKAYGDAGLVIATGGLLLADMVFHWSELRHFCAELHLGYIEEAQQYGSQAEVGTVASLLRDCFLMYGGDHKQTPGGIPDGPVAKKLRMNLMQRPHGLRAPTEYFMVTDLHKVVQKLLEGSDIQEAKEYRKSSTECEAAHGSLFLPNLCGPAEVQYRIRCLLPQPSAPHPLVANGESSLVIAATFALTVLQTPDCVSHCQAANALESSGLQGPHKWALVLPSSSRVASLTYISVVGCRYEQMCRIIMGEWQIGTFASGGVHDLPTGFMPMVWNLHGKTPLPLRAKVVLDLVWSLRQHIDFGVGSEGLLLMCNRRDNTSTLAASWSCKNKDFDVVSSATAAGSTAKVGLIVQRGGNFIAAKPGSDEHHREDCAARATVVLTDPAVSHYT